MTWVKIQYTTTISSTIRTFWSSPFILENFSYAPKNAKLFHRFSKFLKTGNCSALRAHFLPLNRASGEKSTCHDDPLEITKILYISVFSFSNFCHTTFWPIGEVIYNFVRKLQCRKSTKVFGKFLGTKLIYREKWGTPKSLSRWANRHGVLNFCWRPCLRGVITNYCRWLFAIAEMSVFCWFIQISNLSFSNFSNFVLNSKLYP